MTLEELLVEYQMHRIKENPEIAQELDPSHQSYEDWLKEEMGEEYVSEEEMVESMIEYDLQEARTYPDVVTTSFESAD